MVCEGSKCTASCWPSPSEATLRWYSTTQTFLHSRWLLWNVKGACKKIDSGGDEICGKAIWEYVSPLYTCHSYFKIPLVFAGHQLPHVDFFPLRITLGQVLGHVNLENYLASRIPSLRNNSNGHGDSKFSSLLALSRAMQFLHKYAPALHDHVIK